MRFTYANVTREMHPMILALFGLFFIFFHKFLKINEELRYETKPLDILPIVQKY